MDSNEMTPEEARQAQRAWKDDEEAQGYDFGFTPEIARKVLEDEQRGRLEQCQRELDALLKSHGCQLAAQLGISQDGRIVASVVLVNAA